MHTGLICCVGGCLLLLVVSMKVAEAIYLYRRLKHYSRRLQAEVLTEEELRRIQTAVAYIKNQPACLSRVRGLCEGVGREVNVRIQSKHTNERLWNIIK